MHYNVPAALASHLVPLFQTGVSGEVPDGTPPVCPYSVGTLCRFYEVRLLLLCPRQKPGGMHLNFAADSLGGLSYKRRMACGARDLERVRELTSALCPKGAPEPLTADYVLVEAPGSGLVAACAVQSGMQAQARPGGYFHESTFDFLPFERIRTETLEFERWWVLAAHRGPQVYQLLWAGLLAHARVCRARYLLGCASIQSHSRVLGAAAFESLVQRGFLIEPVLQTMPWADFACPLHDGTLSATLPLPWPLLAYLESGARLCGPPALHRSPDCLDFLTLLGR